MPLAISFIPATARPPLARYAHWSGTVVDALNSYARTGGTVTPDLVRERMRVVLAVGTDKEVPPPPRDRKPLRFQALG